MTKFRELFKKWFLRYLKYNIVGLSVFILNIAIYVTIFPYLGEMSYIIVSLNGGIIEFALIAYVNKTKKGIIFDSCSSTNSKSIGVTK
jgi:hypothetical protein